MWFGGLIPRPFHCFVPKSYMQGEPNYRLKQTVKADSLRTFQTTWRHERPIIGAVCCWCRGRGRLHLSEGIQPPQAEMDTPLQVIRLISLPTTNSTVFLGETL